MLRQYQEEIARLRAQLEAAPQPAMPPRLSEQGSATELQMEASILSQPMDGEEEAAMRADIEAELQRKWMTLDTATLAQVRLCTCGLVTHWHDNDQPYTFCHTPFCHTAPRRGYVHVVRCLTRPGASLQGHAGQCQHMHHVWEDVACRPFWLLFSCTLQAMVDVQ